MGLMDTIKGWFGGNKDEVKTGIDKGTDAIKDKAPDQYDGKVQQGGDAAKDAVDKLD